MRRGTGMTDEVRACLSELDVTAEILKEIRDTSNPEDGNRLLEAAKKICHKGFFAAARVYHPDLNQHLPDDEIQAKEARFRRLKSVHDSFMKSTFRVRAKPVTVHASILWSDIVSTRLKREANREILIKMARDIVNKKDKP